MFRHVLIADLITCMSRYRRPSSSCEVVILRKLQEFVWEHLQPLLGKKIHSNSQLKYLTSLLQCIACYLTAYYNEKNPFW